MLWIKVTITRYVSFEPQPGVVEYQLVDVHGRKWSFEEKTSSVNSDEFLDAQTAYPQDGVIPGEVVERRHDPSGREIVWFDTRRPWCVESVDGVTRFEVLFSSLVEW